MEWLQTVWDVVVGVIMSFRVTDALDIALVSFIIYSGIKLVRETRAEQLVKGILIMVIVWILSYYLNLHMIGSLLTTFSSSAFLHCWWCSSRNCAVRWNKSAEAG